MLPNDHSAKLPDNAHLLKAFFYQVKVMKRIAYGYRNLRSFRARILAAVNT